MAETKTRILVVDDDPDFICAHQVALMRAGYLVDAAGSGTEAMERLRQGGVDLVVLDVMLEHDTAGLEVCDAMRQDPKLRCVPVLMVSSVEREEHQQVCAHGLPGCLLCNDFARKPIAPADLVHRVEALLAARRRSSC